MPVSRLPMVAVAATSSGLGQVLGGESGLFAPPGVRFGGDEQRHRQHHSVSSDDACGHEGGFRPLASASL
jgi:hypothetical protein